jgi:hypothetical protein
VSYAYNDELVFFEANSSLEGQFKAIWTAMNCNYPTWDYEEQNGMNWDDIYDDYLIKFRELDSRYDYNNPVPDSIIKVLYYEMFSPLHDGHLYMYLKNIHTGKKIPATIMPQFSRNLRENNDIINEMMDLLLYHSTLRFFENNNELTETVKEEDYFYACFKDGIVYLGLPSFNLYQMFETRDIDEKSDRICKVWESWFNCIQMLHSNGSLKGIIIDVRNNTGGSALDYPYILGALINGNIDNKYQLIGYLREKNGIGRHDYSHPHPFSLPVYKKDHVHIEAPIVLLCNSLSASMSEITCLSAKQLKNGYVIGTKTFGAFSPSWDDSYAVTYSGDVGDPTLAQGDTTYYFAPFYIDMPSSAFLSQDKQVIEGSGILPDEIVHMDSISHKDAQLERALEYIREHY